MMNITTDKYRRIDKRVARRLYENGRTIRLVACKMHPANLYGVGIAEITLDLDKIETYGRDRWDDFDSVVNAFENYNCSYETGYYTAYYIETEEK